MSPTCTEALEGRFLEIARSDDQAIDLGEAAALIGLAEDPATTSAEVARALDALARAARERVPAEGPALARVRGLLDFLFEEEGFAGNEGDYYDVANSYLHRVLERRLGIPITLAVVLIEVARRIGLELAGVGFPTHFLVTAPALPGLYIDPFHGGNLLARGECEAILQRLGGEGGEGGDAGRFLRPASARYILVRMLNNLKAIHLTQSSWERAIAALGRILALLPGSCDALRERGILRIHVGDLAGGIDDLGEFLARAPAGRESQAVRARMIAAERRLRGCH
ncbi:MAG: tetratricopeptide repeat protein [Myxococcales bacterium]|nr:tetratricopeptide repeat protein [Myxococcales bacterium]